MTHRAPTPREQRADEMRARVLQHGAAWAALRRPERLEYDPAQFSDQDDDRRLSLALRDPRAIEAEYRELRLAFWTATNAGAVRLIARRALVLARHLARRSTRWAAA